MGAFLVRRLNPDDASAFQALRLRGLLTDATAFASSYEEEKDVALATIEAQLMMAPERAVFGAFDGERLIGILGLAREQKHKRRHKASIWGVYVVEQERGKGAARMLLAAALSFAQTLPGLLQLNLTVNADNSAAIRLYQLMGFKEFGREIGSLVVDGRTYDELHMCLSFGR